MKRLKEKTQRVSAYLRKRLNKKVVVIASAVLVVGGLGAVFYPRTIQFSYAGDSCINKLVFLPKTLESTSDRQQLSVGGTLDVAGYPLVGREVCVEPIDVPIEGVELAGLAPWGIGFLQQIFRVSVPELPVANTDIMKNPVPAAKPLEVPLSDDDTIFQYQLVSSKGMAECELNGGSKLDCDLPALELAQGQQHELSLERTFDGEVVDILASENVELLPAVTVSGASVDSGQTVYAKPTRFRIETDKPLTSASATLEREEDNGLENESVEVDIDGSDVRIDLEDDDDLPRDKTYVLTLNEAEAEDGSILADPYETRFRLSDGPRVTGINIGGSGVDPNATIVLQLDQALHEDVNLAEYVTVDGVDASVSAAGRSIVVQLQNAGRCDAFRISVESGLLSEHEVESTRDWSHASRTRCYSVETVGTSVNGAAINAYFFGNGGRSLLITGGIHGNELSSVYTTQSLIDDLEANPGQIPDGKQVVIITTANPDGVAIANRDNARNVNLNRNFPTSNWEKDIQTSSGTHKGGGGQSAGSEPETQALVALTNRLNPYLVVTYHSLGSLVNSNSVGIADSVGRSYAVAAGYWFVPSGNTTDTFGFEMTGTYELWLQQRGTPAILIELDTHVGNHYSRNSSAIRNVIGG